VGWAVSTRWGTSRINGMQPRLTSLPRAAQHELQVGRIHGSTTAVGCAGEVAKARSFMRDPGTRNLGSAQLSMVIGYCEIRLGSFIRREFFVLSVCEPPRVRPHCCGSNDRQGGQSKYAASDLPEGQLSPSTTKPLCPAPVMFV